MNAFVTPESVAMATRQKQFISILNLNLGKTVSAGGRGGSVGSNCLLNGAATQRASKQWLETARLRRLCASKGRASRNSGNECHCFHDDRVLTDERRETFEYSETDAEVELCAFGSL